MRVANSSQSGQSSLNARCLFVVDKLAQQLEEVGLPSAGKNILPSISLQQSGLQLQPIVVVERPTAGISEVAGILARLATQNRVHSADEFNEFIDCLVPALWAGRAVMTSKLKFVHDRVLTLFPP